MTPDDERTETVLIGCGAASPLLVFAPPAGAMLLGWLCFGVPAGCHKRPVGICANSLREFEVIDVFDTAPPEEAGDDPR